MSTQSGPDRYLERDGARLRWRLQGTGPALALLHGWALDLDYWEPAVEKLAARFTVLRFDRRGFGLSAGAPDIHRNVADLAALLDEAGIRRAALLGMSQGARLGIHFALAHPERTRALLLDGAPAIDAESELPLAEYRNLLQARGEAALQAAVLRHPLMQLQTEDPAMHRLLASVVARYRGLDLLHAGPRARSPELRELAAPVLIMNGSADEPGRLKAGRMLQRGIAGAEHVLLLHAGHLALLDDPAHYASAVADFCSALPPGDFGAAGD